VGDRAFQERGIAERVLDPIFEWREGVAHELALA
jgi:hypothetical protein